MLSLFSQSTSGQKDASAPLLEHFLRHSKKEQVLVCRSKNCSWKSSGVSKDLDKGCCFAHPEGKSFFSTSSFFAVTWQCPCVSVILWDLPSKISYSQLGQMGTSATAQLLIHFTKIRKKLKWLVQSQPVPHRYC